MHYAPSLLDFLFNLYEELNVLESKLDKISVFFAQFDENRNFLPIFRDLDGFTKEISYRSL